jgi:membrane protease YdiL (CAAX protease family)
MEELETVRPGHHHRGGLLESLEWYRRARLVAYRQAAHPRWRFVSLPPIGHLAITLWLALSVSAGFCEEAVYRGYLQKQFQALSGNAIFALLAQAILFGIGHIYQDYKPVLVISILGLEYGLLAHWRRNLRSAMLSHAWSDAVAGYLKFLWGW